MNPEKCGSESPNLGFLMEVLRKTTKHLLHPELIRRIIAVNGKVAPVLN
jgi:hypothetical protein